MFPTFDLFPVESVGITLTTTVWIGVMVVAFFNLRFGWTLSGLVIPGYLVPLMLCKPISAGIIFFEAVLTYLIVYAISEGPNRSRNWCSFFGRDRFLALVIASVVVRTLLEGWVLPWIGPHWHEWTGWNFDYRNDLHSYGLIVVSLMANYFWKPGLIRGTASLVTTVGITYLIVRFPLLECTNLNIGDIGNLYEDISTSLLDSPKAYIILLTAAFVASWFNLRYSWDYNGILVPSLLALVWYDPTKVFASIVEAIVLLWLARLALKLPIFRKTTMEGARRTALFFSICFLHRLVLCHLCQRFWPSVYVTDLFGFGYLLTTMLAIKAHQKKISIRVIKATIQASTLGAVVGNALGFAMVLLPIGLPAAAVRMQNDSATLLVVSPTETLPSILLQEKLALYRQKLPNHYISPTPIETTRFRTGINALSTYLKTRQPKSLQQAQQNFSAANYSMSIVQDRFLCLRENNPPRGWGVYVFDTRQTDGLVVDVPLPLDEGTMDAGLALFDKTGATVLAIGGTARNTNADRSSDMLANRSTIYSAFHSALSEQGVLQVRRQPETNHEQTKKSEVWIQQKLPRGLNLKRVKSLVTEFDVHWGAAPGKNLPRQQHTHGFAELRLADTDRDRLKTSADGDYPRATRIKRERRAISEYTQTVRDRIAVIYSEAYQPPRIEELLFMDAEVIQPLVRLASAPQMEGQTPGDNELAPIDDAARNLGYRVALLQDSLSDDTFIVLHEDEPMQRYWGTFIFRQGFPKNHIVGVPRPLLERQALEFGANLFEQTRASAFIVAGAHPQSNADGSSNLLRHANKSNLFNTVQQVLLREVGSRGMLVSHARSIRSPVDADVVMAAADGSRGDNLTPLLGEIRDSLTKHGLTIAYVDGREDTAGYEVGIAQQASSLNHSANKEMVSLWVSPNLRQRFKFATEQSLLQSQLTALNVPSLGDNLLAYVLQSNRHGPTAQPITASFREAVHKYIRNSDILGLAALLEQYDDYEFGYILDATTGQVFLSATRPGSLPWIANLNGALQVDDPSSDTIAASFTDRTRIVHFLNGRFRWLQPVEESR